jgi:hypothetical protein
VLGSRALASCREGMTGEPEGLPSATEAVLAARTNRRVRATGYLAAPEAPMDVPRLARAVVGVAPRQATAVAPTSREAACFRG